jgi:hypothetical protein
MPSSFRPLRISLWRDKLQVYRAEAMGNWREGGMRTAKQLGASSRPEPLHLDVFFTDLLSIFYFLSTFYFLLSFSFFPTLSAARPL